MPAARHDDDDDAFRKSICPKVNLIARLEYEVAYYDFVIHRFNHYTTKSPLKRCNKNDKDVEIDLH